MTVISAARRGAWKCRWLLAGLCAVAALLPAVSWGQRADSGAPAIVPAEAPLASQVDAQDGRPADPVDAIKQALLLEIGNSFDLRAKRNKMIETAVPELKTIRQLRRAYFLSEWGNPDPVKDDDALQFRPKIGERLTKAISQTAQGADAEQKISVAIWIADLAGDAGLRDDRDLFKDQFTAKEQFVRGLTGIVLGLLKDKETSVRQAALHALGRITPSPAEVFPALKNALEEKDALGPRRLAAFAMTDLAKNAKAHPRLEQMEVVEKVIVTASFSLRDADESVRGYSLLAILEAAKAFMNHLSTRAEVTIKLDDKLVLAPDLQKLMNAFQTSLPQLLLALDDPKVKVRLTGLQTLDQVCTARAKIVQQLRELEKFAAEKHENASQLLKAYAAPDPLGGIVERDWTYIARLLKDDDERVRRGAIDFLEVLGEQAEPALPAITEALRDPNAFVRWTAARTLRNVPAKKVGYNAVRALAFLLMDPDADVSKAAAITLETLGPGAQDAVPELGHMIANADPANRAWDPDNRLHAMRALAAIGPKLSAAAIPQLIAALADQDARIRRQAAESLGMYGPAARAALPALWQAMRDDDGDVRLNASEAILNIKSGKK
jgi:HEAT repeat protein